MIWTWCILVMLLMSYLYLVFEFLPQLASGASTASNPFAAWMAHGVKVPTTLIVGGSGSAMPNLFLNPTGK